MNDLCECGPCTYTLEDITALGKRLVACKGFRPMRGMLDLQGRTWDTSLLWRWNNDVDVPDLRDPATVGCVLALVREAYKDSTIFAESFDSGESWCITRPDKRGLRTAGVWGHGGVGRGKWIEASSEAEALVAALEVAP